MCMQLTTYFHAVTRLEIRGAVNPTNTFAWSGAQAQTTFVAFTYVAAEAVLWNLLLVLEGTIEGVDTHNRPLKLIFRDSGDGEINSGSYCHLLFGKILYFHVLFK